MPTLAQCSLALQDSGSQSVVPRLAASMLPGKLVRSADSQAPYQSYRMKNCGGGAQQAVLTSPPGDSDACKV